MLDMNGTGGVKRAGACTSARINDLPDMISDHGQWTNEQNCANARMGLLACLSQS
jgi:hypothetical protein